MRRTSLTPEQAARLAVILRNRRNTLQYSIRDIAALSGLHLATISQLEAGNILAPQPDTLKALATALELAVSDLYAAVEWLPAHELPSLRPYMRAKYRDLDDDSIADLERYAEQLIERHGATGPRAREDEVPE